MRDKAARLSAPSRQENSCRRLIGEMTQEEFLARAWQAANEKAHELGWIIDPGT
jgi:hypothetical protein